MSHQSSFQPFLLEEWQSRYEQTVRYNLADSGVQPISMRELLSEEQIEQLLDLPIHYPEVNGSHALRTQIASHYANATAQHVLVTVGAAEANQIICQTLLQPGDQVVVMEPGIVRAMVPTTRRTSIRSTGGTAWLESTTRRRSRRTPWTNSCGGITTPPTRATRRTSKRRFSQRS